MENKESYHKILNQIGYKPYDIDWSKVETWIGDNRRSDFEFYRDLTESAQLNEKMQGFKTLGESIDPTGVFLSLLEFLSIETTDTNTSKGNEIFFNRMSEFIPKHDTIERYPNFEENLNNTNPMDLENQVKLLEKFLIQLTEIQTKLDDSMNHYINSCKALESAKLAKEFLEPIKNDAREMQKKHIEPMKSEIEKDDKPRIQNAIINLKKAIASMKSANN
jgi:hypothetical protein